MRLLFVILFAIVGSFCSWQALAQTPGNTRVTIKNPDPAKWAGKSNFFSNSSGEFNCRPLACPAPSKVTARISSSPTRSPDRQALENYARRDVPAAIDQFNVNAGSSMTPGRKMVRISNRVSNIRGYPAVVQEVRLVGGSKDMYVSRATMFVKSALVDIASYSLSADTARRNRDIFTNAMAVEDTPIR